MRWSKKLKYVFLEKKTEMTCCKKLRKNNINNNSEDKKLKLGHPKKEDKIIFLSEKFFFLYPIQDNLLLQVKEQGKQCSLIFGSPIVIGDYNII